MNIVVEHTDGTIHKFSGRVECFRNYFGIVKDDEKSGVLLPFFSVKGISWKESEPSPGGNP